jgi:TP901 family phage tail tape measure protein
MADTRTLKVVVVGNGKSGQKMLRDLGIEAEGAGKKASGGAGKFSAMGATVARVGASMAAGVAVAGVAAAGMIYKVGASYEQSLNTIESLRQSTDATTQQIATRLEGMSGSFAKLGLSTGDAANGVVELVKAGQSVDQAMKSVNATMQLSVAGQVSVAEASALVANTLNTFKLSADNARRVSDALANAANASSSDISDLGYGLSMSSLAAKSAGLSIEQTAASLALLSNNGLQGSDAGTSLKTMLMAMNAPTKEASKALKDLGVNVYDSKGKSLDFRKVLTQLLPALNKLSDQKRNAAIREIFGADAMRAVNAFASEGVKGFDGVMKSISATGTAAKTAQAKTAGFSGLVNRIKAQSTSAGQALYRGLAPGLTEVGNKLLDLSAKGPGAAKKLFSSLKGQASGGGVGSAIMGEFKKLGPVIKGFVSAILPVIQNFGHKLMATVGPGLNAIGKVIATQFLPGVRAIIPVLTPVVKFILNFLGNAVIGVVKGAINVIKGVFQILGGLFKLIAALVKGDWGGMWAAVKTIFSGAINVIKGAFQIWMNIGILSVFKKGILGILRFGKSGWGAIKGVFSSGTKAIGNVMGFVIKFITAPYRFAFQIAKSIVTGSWTFIRGRFAGGVGGIRGVLSKLGSIVSAPFRVAFQLAKTIVQVHWAALKLVFSAGKTAVVAVVQGIPKLIVGVFSKAGSMLTGIGRNIVQGLVNGIKNAAGAVLGAAQQLVDKIPGPIRKAMGIHSPSRVMMEIGRHIANGLKIGIEKGLPALRTTVAALRREVYALSDKKLINKGQKRYLLDQITLGYAAASKKIREQAAAFKKLQDNLSKTVVNSLAGMAGKTAQAVTATFLAAFKGVAAAFAGGAITKTARDHLTAYLKKMDDRALALVKRREKLTKMLTAANKRYAASQAKLAALTEARSAMSQSYRDKGREFASLSAVAGDGTAENPTNIEAIIYRFQKKLGALKNFRANLSALIKRGVNTGIIDQIIGLGPEQGSQVAAALLKGTAGQLAQLNSLDYAIGSETYNGGNQIAGSVYNKSIAQASRQAAKDRQSVINVQMTIQGNVTAEKALAATIAKAVRDEIERDKKRNGKK